MSEYDSLIQIVGKPFTKSFNVVFDLGKIHKVVVWPKVNDDQHSKKSIDNPKKPAPKKNQKALQLDIPYFNAIRKDKQALPAR